MTDIIDEIDRRITALMEDRDREGMSYHEKAACTDKIHALVDLKRWLKNNPQPKPPKPAGQSYRDGWMAAAENLRQEADAPHARADFYPHHYLHMASDHLRDNAPKEADHD